MEEKSIWLSKKHCTSTTANTLNLPVCYEQNQRYETKNTGYFSLKIFPKKYHGKCRVSKVRCSTSVLSGLYSGKPPCINFHQTALSVVNDAHCIAPLLRLADENLCPIKRGTLSCGVTPDIIWSVH